MASSWGLKFFNRGAKAIPKSDALAVDDIAEAFYDLFISLLSSALSPEGADASTFGRDTESWNLAPEDAEKLAPLLVPFDFAPASAKRKFRQVAYDAISEARALDLFAAKNKARAR